MNSDRIFRNLLLSEELSDVRVIVDKKIGGRSNFPAHSLALKRGSPVLAKMLESDLVEGQTQTIVITDFKANHIEMLLTFLYTDILPECYTGLCKLVKIADKYLVSTLTEKCEKALLDFVNLQNVYELCCLADTYSLEKLFDKCLLLIKRVAYKLLKCDDVKCFSKEIMENIVRANDLNVTKEIDVFWAVWRWGNLKLRSLGMPFANDNVREFIQDLIKHVRWIKIDKDLENIVDLGITVDDADLQKECQYRKPSTSNTRWFLSKCNVLCVAECATSCSLLKHHFSASSKVTVLMCAVSLSDLPIYVVGVSLILYAEEPIQA